MGEHVAMKLLSMIFLVAGVVAAQSAPSRKDTQDPWAVVSQTPILAARSIPPQKDIPTIAKDSSGVIVSIITSGKDGRPVSQGSGFLVSKDGRIVTNYHVVQNASSAVVKLPNGAFYDVEGMLASDKDRDVAVIKAKGQNFRTATLGSSDRLQVGETVVAIGSPLSLESTVSSGILSGIRNMEGAGGKFLQITAPISPGSSGGPLFNMAGEVVGITTLYLKGGENLNFAIPINDAKRLLLPSFSKIHDLPNETEPVKAQSHDGDAPPSVSATDQVPGAPDLKTTAEFMSRMVEPEHRQVVQGELTGAELHSRNGLSITIISDQLMILMVTTGVTHEHGYPEFTYTVLSDGDGKHEQKDYPRYVSFSPGSIDPSSIRSIKGGYDIDTLSGFMNRHPHCEADPQCAHEYSIFLDSAPKMIAVRFHTTDLKPLIERGGLESQQTCSENEKRDGKCGLKPIVTENTNGVTIFFKDEDRAERFVTALTYAVKLEGGKPDLFPPTR